MCSHGYLEVFCHGYDATALCSKLRNSAANERTVQDWFYSGYERF